MIEKRLRLFAFYWFIAYVFWLPFYAALKFNYINILKLGYTQIIAINISYLITLLITSLIILRVLGKKRYREMFGLKSENLSMSFTYGGLVLIPSMIINLTTLILIINGTIDPKTFLQGNLPTIIISKFGREIVPLVAIIHWFVSGFVSFMLLQAFPVELSYGEMEQRKLFLANLLLWSGLYNGLFYSILFNLPLNVSILGEIIDIIVLGFLFIAAYMKTRNCLWLIIGYVFVYEAPVKASIYYGWGINALIAILLLGVIWPAYSLIQYIAKKVKQTW